MVGLDRARSESCSPSRSPCVAGTGRKELRAAPDGRVDAAMQARHQRRRHAPEHAWLKFRQQLDRGAPALDLLVSRDVSAHGARLGLRRPAGKPLGKTAEVAPACRGTATAGQGPSSKHLEAVGVGVAVR